MNTYKISFTRENGTQGADHFTAATEAQARKDFGVCYRHSSATIVSVELVQTDAPATKQQERDTLEKIKKMVTQRHAAILGSTGSGKSWCVANILEKASTLQHANIIVFDMHGEYEKLAVGPNPIAERYRIAGPGDLETPNSDVLFLPYWLLNREELLSMILDRSDSNAPNQASRFTLLD